MDTSGSACLEELGQIEQKTNTDYAKNWERKDAFVLPPWEKRVSYFIEPSEAVTATDDSITQKNRTQGGSETSLIFTDGNGFEGFKGHIGAAGGVFGNF
jgi:hypothetical protein